MAALPDPSLNRLRLRQKGVPKRAEQASIMAKRGLDKENSGLLKSILGNGLRLSLTPPSKSTRRTLAEELGGKSEGGSTASGSNRSPTESSGSEGSKGKGKGKGKGQNRRGSAKEVPKLGDGNQEKRLASLEGVMMMVMRLLCTVVQEQRRVAQESQLVFEFPASTVFPQLFEHGKTKWTSEIPEASEEEPWPLHKEGPWRHIAFQLMGKAIAHHLGEKTIEGEDDKKQAQELAAMIHDLPTIKNGVLRFWRMRGLPQGEGGAAMDDEDATEQKELWIIKFDNNNAGRKLSTAFQYLDSSNVMSECGITLRPDRAPKGGLQRGVEKAIELVLGERSGRDNRTNNKK